MKHLAAIIVFLSFISSCNTSGQKEVVAEKQKAVTDSINRLMASVKDGDLVFRNGKDMTSDAIRDFSLTDKSYSHCGIVFHEGDSLMVYHMYAGEENPGGVMQREWVNYFVDGQRNKSFAVYRYNIDTAEEKKFRQQVLALFNRHIVFDMNFDYRTDDEQYCAEMISKSISAATDKRITLPHTTIEMNNVVKKYLNHFPEMKRRIEIVKPKKLEYIAIDNLYLNPFAAKIGEVSFE